MSKSVIFDNYSLKKKTEIKPEIKLTTPSNLVHYSMLLRVRHLDFVKIK